MRSPSTSFIAPIASTAGLVVWESDAHWGPLWRRELTAAVPLVAVRHVDDAWAGLQRWPHGALAVELSQTQAPQTIALLARIQAELPSVLCVVHLPADFSGWELLVREAGATLIVRSPWQLTVVAPQLSRHFGRAPQPAVSFREEIWRRLPWRESASATTHPTTEN